METTQIPIQDPPSTFPDLPPFPDNVPTAPLLRLSLQKLMNGDKHESEAFVKACTELGFFYLDLRGSMVGEKVLTDAERLFDVQKGLFDMELEEKRRFDFVNHGERKSLFGYRALGTGTADEKGSLDRYESYNISKDDVLDLSPPWPAPPILAANRPLFTSYARSAHSIILFLMSELEAHLHYPASTFTSRHRLTAPSGDQIRFIKNPPQPMDDRRTSLGEHTDFGSFTLLLNRLGGLQVLPPGENAQWRYVRPLPGHAIINLGDAMTKFTNGLLRSNVHRVVAPPGEQANSTRYSLVYFSRPENDVLLKRLEGSDLVPELGEGDVEEDICAREWITRKAMSTRPGGYDRKQWEGSEEGPRVARDSRM